MNLFRTRFGLIIAVVALLAAACSSSTDPEEVATTVIPGEDEGTTTTTTSPDATSPDETVERTASFRGVTEDTIKVGFVDVDFARLKADLGIDVNSPDTGLVIESLVADLNDRGGINGRMIELVVERFLPTDSTTADAACARLVEDEEVFAVLGGFGGPGSEDSNTCFTGVGNTILVGGKLTDERLADAQAPWVTPNMNDSRRGQAFVNALVASGELETLGTLSVHAIDSDQDATADVVYQALVDAGADVAARTTGESSSDQIAVEDNVNVMMERVRVDGVDSIVVVGVSPVVTDAILASNDFTVVLPNTEDVSSLTNSTFSEGNRMVGTGSIPDAEDPVLSHCIDLAKERIDLDELSPEILSGDDLTYWTSTTRACQNLWLFEAIALEAGVDLTNESFAAALSSVEVPALPVVQFASLGADKPDARDTLSILEWDGGLATFVEVAGPFDVRDLS